MGEAIDTDLFRLVSSSALQALLDKIIGPKTLVLAPNLAGPLGLVTEVGLLKVGFHFAVTLPLSHLQKFN